MADSVSLVIPMYNCAETAADTAAFCVDYLNMHGYDWELMLVNDGSKDETASVLRKLSSGDPRIRAVSYEVNHGKGYAVKSGIMSSSKAKIVFTDADLAYGLEPLPRFLSALDTSDVAAGSRRPGKGERSTADTYGVKRTILSRVFTLFSKIILGLSLPDTQCGFKGFKSTAAKKLFSDLETERFGFDLEILALAKYYGMKTDVVHAALLSHGTSTVAPVKDGFNMLKDMFAVRKKINRLKKEEKR